MSTQGYLTTIELQKESMSFSAGHTTIFSSTQRETLHGHHYTVYLALNAWIKKDLGMAFDYRYYKKKMQNLCHQLHRTFLMPTQSPFLTREEDAQYYYFMFNHQKIPFRKEDVTLLPVTNVTIEELARWFVERLIEDQDTLQQHAIEKIVVKVFSAPGQSGSYTWEKKLGA